MTGLGGADAWPSEHPHAQCIEVDRKAIARARAEIPPCEIREIGEEAEGSLDITHAVTTAYPYVRVEVELEDEFQFRWSPATERDIIIRLDDLVVASALRLFVNFDVFVVRRDAAGLPCEGFPAALRTASVLSSRTIEVPEFTGRPPGSTEVTGELLRSVIRDPDEVVGLVVKVNVRGFFGFPTRVSYRITSEAEP